MNIKIPDEVQHIINTLEKNGYEAYAVGGCLRDAFLGAEPKDWDVCTPALPEQTMKCFDGLHIIKTGLRHGTITLVLNGNPFEITTYRVDGTYSDNRHPDSVEFVKDLKEDLSRRDFTINAMAYNPKKGVVDFFDGISDIKKQVVRCVGSADERFREDALRIMRALRLASTLNFSIEDDTSEAIHDTRCLLGKIAVERISKELNKLIVGRNAGNILLRYVPVIWEIIPEIRAMIEFEQNNPYHYLDVWKHTVTSVTNAPIDVILRLTMLFHDIAKPECYSEAEGVGHFHGHPQTGSRIAGKILSRLRYDNCTTRTIKQLIFYHDVEILPTRKHVKRWLYKIGEERFRQLIDVKRADAMAQTEEYRRKKLATLDDILLITDEIIEQRQCFSLGDMAVNGRDLIAAGIPEGIEIGRMLNRLVSMVVDETVENDRAKLLEATQEFLKEGL